MPCTIPILPELSSSWCDARKQISLYIQALSEAIVDIDEIKFVRIGSAPPFDFLWPNCPTPPDGAIVFEITDNVFRTPRFYYYTGGTWSGPLSFGQQNNTIRVVSEDEDNPNDFNLYFDNLQPVSTGALVIHDIINPRRRHYSYNGISWAEYAKPPLLFGSNSVSDVVNQVNSPSLFTAIQLQTTVGDLFVVGWDGFGTPINTPNTMAIDIVIPGYFTAHYQGLNSVAAQGSVAYIATANAVFNIDFLVAMTDHAIFTVRRLWVNLYRINN